MGTTGCLQPVLSSLSRATGIDRFEPGFDGRVDVGLKRTKHWLQAASGTQISPLEFSRPAPPRRKGTNGARLT